MQVIEINTDVDFLGKLNIYFILVKISAGVCSSVFVYRTSNTQLLEYY